MAYRILRFATALLGAIVLPAFAATIAVNTTADVVNPTDGLCSLREAITAVNTGNYSGNVNGECTKGDGNTDTIIVPAGTYALTILGPDEDNNATGDLDIRANVAIVGAGMDSTRIDASGLGSTPDRVLDISTTGNNVSVRGLAIEHGHAPDGTAANGGNGENGGGIKVQNTYLALVDVDIHDNHSGALFDSSGVGGSVGNSGDGAGIHVICCSLILVRSFVRNNLGDTGAGANSLGGGILASVSSVTIYASRIADNQGNGGGGIFCAYGCSMNVSQSSITGNTANGGGGGIYMAGQALTFSNSTLAQNVSANNGAGVYSLIQESTQANPQFEFATISGNQGIGIYFDDITGTGAIGLRNSIIAANDGDDCYLHIDGSFFSQGYNFSGSGCPVGANDIASGSNNPLRLGPLAPSADGLTDVMLPHPDSPATNAGSCSGSNLFSDQRGHARPADVPRVAWKFDGCDIGAAELDDDIFWSNLDNN